MREKFFDMLNQLKQKRNFDLNITEIYKNGKENLEKYK